MFVVTPLASRLLAYTETGVVTVFAGATVQIFALMQTATKQNVNVNLRQSRVQNKVAVAARPPRTFCERSTI